MRLDSVTRIERFMVDSLLSSPLVPLGVNVVRLADETDPEGILNMTRSISVRYVSSNISVTQRSPMVLERTMTFEVTIAAQSYLANSGHDAAIQMLGAAYESLGNKVPMNSGLEILEPFHLTNERFNGLSDSSHYIYIQDWQIIAQDAYRSLPIDPCVMRGNCSQLWSPSLTEPLKPGDVLWGGIAYEPVLPPPPGVDYEPQYAGVDARDGNLYYKWNEEEVFLYDYESYKLRPTGKFDTSGQFLIVNAYGPNGEFELEYFATDSGRRVLSVNLDLTPSRLDHVGIDSESGFNEQVPVPPNIGSGLLRPAVGGAMVYKDPLNLELGSVPIKGDVLVPFQTQVSMMVDGHEFHQVGNIPGFGSGWVLDEHVEIVPPEEYLPQVDCDEAGLSDLKPIDPQPNQGPIDSCE